MVGSMYFNMLTATKETGVCAEYLPCYRSGCRCFLQTSCLAKG